MVSPEYKLGIECTFDAFSKATMRFEARTCRRTIVQKQQREISFEYLLEERYFGASDLINSFIVQPTHELQTHFHVRGYTVAIENEHLATALMRLPELKRDYILLLYFLGFKEKEVAKMYGLKGHTINYHKNKSLKLLRQEMERIEYEAV